MRCSRTSTQPTVARGQVARVATVRAISMKYVSQDGRMPVALRAPHYLRGNGGAPGGEPAAHCTVAGIWPVSTRFS